MLKSLVDEDDFCKKLRMSWDEEPGTSFYACFYSLLMSPSSQLLENLLSNYMMQDVVNGLKHLIKFKFSRLTDEVAANILVVVKMILDYEENLDTLVVNLLRHHLVDEVYSIYRDKRKYFDDHPSCLAFLVFFCTQNPSTQGEFDDSSLSSRDFLFMRMKGMWDDFYSNRAQKKTLKNEQKHMEEETLVPAIFPFDFPENQLVEILFTPTPINILFSQLSVELEMNIIFILENEQNFNFHMLILFKDYIKSEREACWVLRFLANIPRPLNIARLVDAILKKYPSSLVALIYDLLFWNQMEHLNGNLAEYLRKEPNEASQRLGILQEDWGMLKLAMENISQKHEQTMESVVRTIHGLNFYKYYGMIKEMEKWSTPIIPKEMYSRVISESFGWDGYAQVYLWKILGFQKIYFGFDVDEFTEGSFEAMEGLEIVRSLQVLAKG